MKTIFTAFSSSVGKKLLMAFTGILLSLFLIAPSPFSLISADEADEGSFTRSSRLTVSNEANRMPTLTDLGYLIQRPNDLKVSI